MRWPWVSRALYERADQEAAQLRAERDRLLETVLALRKDGYQVPTAEPAGLARAAQDPEVLAQQAATEAAIERGARDLMRTAEQMGIGIPYEAAVAEARRMLLAASAIGPEGAERSPAWP